MVPMPDYLKLKDQYDWMQRQVFGSKSERIVLTPDEQQSLFSAGDIQNTGGFEVMEKLLLDPGNRVKTHLRTTTPAGHGKGALPESLPRVDIHVPLTDAQLAEVKNNSLILVREEFTERLAIYPQSFYVKRFIRPIYSFQDAEGQRHIVTTKVPEMAVEKGRADLSILIYLSVSKFVDHLPLDRIRKIFLRMGMKLSISTLCDFVESFHDILLPVYLAMADEVKKCNLIHTDDTVVRVVRKDKPKKTHKGRMWVYIGGEHCVYVYTPTRAGANPSEFLKGFKGHLQADGYAGYNRTANREDVIRVGCHAHARRYFENALEQFPEALEMIKWYQELFQIERRMTDTSMPDEARKKERRLYSEPIMKKMKTGLDEKAVTQMLPKSLIYKAVFYALGQWESLVQFLEDGKIPLSNNISERAMRGVVMGRKNYLFFGSEEAAQRGAVFYSVLHSCVCLGMSPEEYLQDIIPRLGTVSAKDILQLTPVGWLAAKTVI